MRRVFRGKLLDPSSGSSNRAQGPPNSRMMQTSKSMSRTEKQNRLSAVSEVWVVVSCVCLCSSDHLILFGNTR